MELKPASGAEFSVARVQDLAGSEALVEAAREEGFNFLDRLVTEWLDGTNRFDTEDEVLFGAYAKGVLIGTAGLTRQGPALGRVRRVYVHPSRRKQGIAAKLMSHVLEFAARHYPVLVLYTETEEASRLYQRLGFNLESPCEPDHATHRLDLSKLRAM